MRFPRSRLRAALLLSLLVWVSACSGLGGEPRIIATQLPPTAAPSGPDDLGYPLTPPDMAQGAAIFAQHCTECHGDTGQGDGELVQTGQVPPPTDFTDPATARHQRPTEWFETITNGRIENLMPPWGNALSEEERWAVALYTYTMAYTPEQLSLGQTLYDAECAECHGATGQGDGPEATELSRPVGDFTNLLEMVALSDTVHFNIITEGQGQQMPAYMDDLTEAERWAIVAYVRSLALANVEAIGAPAEATPEATQEAVSRTIEGQISSGTAGGILPPNLPVTLYVIRPTDEGITNDMFEATADTNGQFVFENIAIAPDTRVIASTDYRERVFTSELVAGADLSDEPLPLPIYELTEDPTVIRIRDFFMQIDPLTDGIQVLQDVTFENVSDRLYTNSMQADATRYASVVVGMPPGAIGLAFPNNQNRYVIGEAQNVVVDTIPVLPRQEHRVQFSYFLPYDGGAVIEQPVYYNADGDGEILVQPASLRLTSDQFALDEAQTQTMSVYQVYSGALSLVPGEVIRFELSGSLAQASDETANPLTLIVILLVGAILIAIVFLWMVRRQKPAPAASNRQALIDGLIRQIADLDNLHEAGRIDSTSYEPRRAALKARLAELMSQPEKKS